MTKKNSTKRALISSLLIMAMCFSMLVGSTFAWFTDSVTSSGNRIVSGTLAVDLLMYKDSAYTSIAGGSGDIFTEAEVAQNSTATLWEPGKTQVVFLGVENKGSLALKYNIVLNISDIDGKASMVQNNFSALQYAVIDGQQHVDVSTTSWETVKADAQVGDVLVGTMTAAPNGALDPTEIDYFALAVHMKEEAGNEFQDAAALIDITVVATQLAKEEDSFGNDYDQRAELPAVRALATAKVANGEASFTANDAPVDNKTTTVEINGLAAEENNNLTLSVDTADFETAKTAFTVEANHTAVAGIDLTLEKNGTKVTFDNGSATVTTYILPGLDPAKVTVKYNGTGSQPTDVSYDTETGALTFTTTHFSEFYADYEGEFVYLEKTGRAYTDFYAFGYEVYALAEKEVDLSKTDTQSIIDGYGYSNGHWAIATYLIGGSGKPGCVDSWKLGYTTNTEEELLAIMREYYDAWDAIWDSIVMYPTLPDDGSVIRIWAPQQPIGEAIGDDGEW